MTKKTKAYHIKLKRNDIFEVYQSNGVVRLITDKKYPYPHSRDKWSVADGFDKIMPPNPDMHFISSIIIPKEDVEKYLMINIPVCLSAMKAAKLDNNNIFILSKEHDNFIEIGLAALLGRGIRLHKFATRYLKLKAFW